MRKGKVEQEKRKETEIESGGSQDPEEASKMSKDTNRIENERFGNSVD